MAAQRTISSCAPRREGSCAANGDQSLAKQTLRYRFRACISGVPAPGSPEYAGAAPVLALLSGLILLAMGVFRLGFLANRLSHPVISGFITASSILIATGQLKYLLGVAAGGHGLFEMALSLAARLGQVHWPTFVIGAAATGFLFWTCKGLKPALIALSVPARAAALLTRTGPVLLLALSILAVRWVDIDAGGVAAIGAVLGV